ncbi:hypothetical protein CLV30_10982 [Haloactinopolyspora alba]|uniref:Uncharacterized protein n=1 Tax=Haloactinopolyspora alba TaxID=648780 RepID=A0A2P8DZX9_9ACTN|nr:hypothetical protein [Haloactinopolyspora alba]PSL02775.1 hypothetical protein CLV30_10982 [Haloactinopolyspora alba]
MTRTTDSLATLRTLDPADSDVDPHTPGARATLERILATDPGQRHDHEPAKARSRRGVRVVAVASATVVTAGTVFVVIPSLTGGDDAFATWTAVPSSVSSEDAADAAGDCRDAQQDGPAQAGGTAPDFSDDLRRAELAIAERRGEWTLVTFAGTGGFSATCITDESAPLFRDWFGSIGAPAAYTAPGPRDVVATDLGAGEADAGELSVAAGIVGSEVTGVSYRSASHGEVVATVSGGRFALWFPGDELDGAGGAGVGLHVTYRDGSTAELRLDLR